jgi:hypothetical protein
VPFADAARLPRDGDAPNVHLGAATARVELNAAQLPDVETAAHRRSDRGVQLDRCSWTWGATAGRTGMDLARTGGWFSDFHPLLLRTDAGAPAARLAAVRSQVRSMPNRDAGHVPLRYGADELAEVPPSELSVNDRRR